MLRPSLSNEHEGKVTGSATIKTRMSVPAKDTGLRKNGFLVFGDGTTDAKLIKCGVRLVSKRAVVIEGPLADGKAKGAAIGAGPGEVIEIAVTVDQVAGGATLYRVTATVVWRGASRSRRMQLQSLIAGRK